MTQRDLAADLLRLHTDPELLVLVNVWDVASAKVVAGLPGARAIATASYAIAASFGYDDGEQIPVDIMIDAVARIVAATTLPVTADLEAGYGNAGETVRRAIDVGVVGANIEDGLRPLDEAVANVRAVIAAGESAGIPFVLNARTDAWLLGGDRDAWVILDDAIERGRAYLDAGAACFFVPGSLDLPTIEAVVSALGERKISTIGFPGSPDPALQAAAGVARLSYGPGPQQVALKALAEVGTELLAGGSLAP
jgi:2-methylisocitrate lyase-like PEP mutase family enzyme